MDVADWATDWMERLGAPGAGLAIALENVFPPLPSEVILPLAGFAAARGDLSLIAAILFTTAGSLAGALVLYGVGAALGRRRMRALAARVPLIDLDDVDKAEGWFQRHGAKAVLIARVVPVVRSLISIPAGVERMPLPTFMLLTTIGSAVWNSALIGAGYLLGDRYHVVEQYLGIVQWIVLAVVLVAVVWFVTTRIRKARANS